MTWIFLIIHPCMPLLNRIDQIKKKCQKSEKELDLNIVIIDPIEPHPYLFAKLRFTPTNWSYLPSYATRTQLSKAREEALKGTINYLKRVRQEEPTQQDVEKMYLGIDKQGHTDVEKLIGIINDFEKKEKETVAGYLCVIDEIYPNIEEILEKAIKKYATFGISLGDT